MSIGLGSKYDGEGLIKHSARPKLNLVICLDNSGSMGERFSDANSPPKMTVAINSLLVLLNKLRPDDMFGLVTFNTVKSTKVKLLMNRHQLSFIHYNYGKTLTLLN